MRPSPRSSERHGSCRFNERSSRAAFRGDVTLHQASMSRQRPPMCPLFGVGYPRCATSQTSFVCLRFRSKNEGVSQFVRERVTSDALIAPPSLACRQTGKRIAIETRQNIPARAPAFSNDRREQDRRWATIAAVVEPRRAHPHTTGVLVTNHPVRVDTTPELGILWDRGIIREPLPVQWVPPFLPSTRKHGNRCGKRPQIRRQIFLPASASHLIFE